MKKIIITLAVFLLSGCSYFTQEPESLTADLANEQSEASEATSTQDEISEQEANQKDEASSVDNDSFDNVFDEFVIGQDRYPNTMLPNNIPISELRTAINEYYTVALSQEDKELNFEKVEPETLESLQNHFSDNEVFSPLDITVDQIEITLDGQANYVARIVIDMTYEEAEEIVEDNDILVLNESMAQLDNRLVLVAYHDKETNTLLPYHLTNSTNSLFSLRDKDNQTPDASSLDIEQSSSNESTTESEE
ncbi:hypothetical protein ACF3NG_09725 [Aerococcaceae bacterium WGS1372]